ncbi:MAG: hypothetical protein P1U56_19200 [Saprospiraceae bacterium]|nr:hypothetical protein [Saprospiraceae bacterium]
MKILRTVSCLIGLLFILSNCNDGQSKPKMGILHPNNDSELTLLMRDMYDYYEGIKENVEQGNLPENIREFAEIHNAVSTEPSKAESPLYKAMSQVYLESAKRFSSSTGNTKELFNNMVDNCMNCHQQMCPGPMVKIKKLYVKK